MFYNMFRRNNDEVVSSDVVRKLTDLSELRDASHCLVPHLCNARARVRSPARVLHR